MFPLVAAINTEGLHSTAVLWTFDAAKAGQGLPQGRLKHPQIAAVRDHPEALLQEVAAGSQVGGLDAGGLLCLDVQGVFVVVCTLPFTGLTA